MSTLRKQSILSSIIIYIGFALGFLNNYLFAREGGFTKTEYGLTSIFIAIANVMYSVAIVGMPSYIYKFYPYYKAQLPPRKNDMMSVALVSSIVGFLLVMLSGFIFKDFVIRKYQSNAPELIRYYYWLFPFGFGLTLYTLLEAFAWQLRLTPLTNFLREVFFRLLTTVLIILFYLGLLRDFDLFIKIYASTYIITAGVLAAYLIVSKKLYLTFSISRLTKKFRKKIMALAAFVWGGNIVFTLSQMFDSIVIASVLPDGLAFVGVYTLAQNIASLVQAPQRAIVSSAIAPLSQAWKDKDLAKIDRIYHRSSINQLLFAVGMFVLIWINFTDGVLSFHLKKEYLAAKEVFLFIGLMRIVDLGTGLNSQIIGTSLFWRFDFITGVILLAITLPLNYWLTKTMGVTGPAIANLLALSLYNAFRYWFLLRKFNLQPFTLKSLYVLLMGLAGYMICHYAFDAMQGFGWIVLRSLVFIAFYVSCTLALRISPDVIPVWQSLMQRLGWNKQK